MKVLSRSLRLLAVVVVCLVVLLLIVPSPIDPVAFQPGPGPELVGPLAVNEALRSAEILAPEAFQGSEDVAVDEAGRIYGGTEHGKILRLIPGLNAYTVETFADTGGRPLGLAFDASGNLVVADASQGLLSIDAGGKITVLTTGVEGVPFAFTDDVDIGPDGVIYFSDASDRFGVHEYLHDLLEARPHGRLLAFDPATGTTRVLLRDLYFANGIAVASDGSFVLVNETYRYRITRYWLRGPKAGTSDIFMDDLPGFADGVSSNGRGVFWIAFFTVRNPVIDRFHPHPWAKALLAKLPKFLWPKPAPYGFVAAVDEEGRFLASYHDPGGLHVQEVTSVEEDGDFLYLGTLKGRGIARWRKTQEW